MGSITHAAGLLQEKLKTWLESCILVLPNFLVALLVLVVSYLLSRRLSAVVRGMLSRFVKNQALINFLGILVRITVLLLGFLIALRILDLDDAFFSVMAGVGIAGIAIGFAFQDVASNFIAGIALVFRSDRPFKVGDVVETNDFIGVIKEINLRDTLLETFHGHSIFIPNKLIFENAVVNYTLKGQRRVDLQVGISYGEDLEKVKEVTMAALEPVTGKLAARPVEFYFEEFGNSSINFQVRVWIPFVSQPEYLRTRSDMVVRIKKAYDQHGITIPFPIRTLDFGIKGGEKLSAMLSSKEGFGS
ncbi:MAG: mechanosensitive ion channel [Candidatus Omnitrophica bacterium]|nr:mechanosensitive ion channel [Candidatus Omnitrophota bacterium]